MRCQSFIWRKQMESISEQSNISVVKKSRAPYVSGIVALFCYIGFLALITFWGVDQWMGDLFEKHYLFFVGPPFAGLVAHFLVGTLENARGKIEFEVIGLKFKGASGPIVMWTLVFLIIVVCMRLTWNV